MEEEWKLWKGKGAKSLHGSNTWEVKYLHGKSPLHDKLGKISA